MLFGRNRDGRWPITHLLVAILFVGMIVGFGAGHVMWPKKVTVERLGVMFEPEMGQGYKLVAMNAVVATTGYFPEPTPIEALELFIRTPIADHPGWEMTHIISVPTSVTTLVPTLPGNSVIFVNTTLGNQVFYNNGSAASPSTRPRDQIFSNVAFVR